ncbi:MAG: hypothetical protein WD042_06960 [Phycisphaeraceae bacterium]
MAEGEEAAPPAAALAPTPDFANMSRVELEMAAIEYHHQIQQLQREVDELKGKLAKAGGESDVIELAVKLEGDDKGASDDMYLKVKVLSNKEPDVEGLKKQIADERARLDDTVTMDGTRRLVNKGLHSRVADLRRELAKKSAETEQYYDRLVGAYRTRKKYSDRDLANLRIELSKLDKERAQVTRQVALLEGQIKDQQSKRLINAITADGQAIVLVAKGNYMALAEVLKEGGTYMVTCRSTGGQQYLVKAATPAGVTTAATP